MNTVNISATVELLILPVVNCVFSNTFGAKTMFSLVLVLQFSFVL